jgi:hypothetical protein
MPMHAGESAKTQPPRRSRECLLLNDTLPVLALVVLQPEQCQPRVNFAANNVRLLSYLHHDYALKLLRALAITNFTSRSTVSNCYKYIALLDSNLHFKPLFLILGFYLLKFISQVD